MKISRKLWVAALLLLGGISPALSATEGTLGDSSTATLDITVTIPEIFRISQLADFNLGAFSGSGDKEANEDVCVYSNGDGTYQVTVTDNSGLSPDSFAVENAGGTAQIPMNVFWNDQAGTAGGVELSYGIPLASTGANTSSFDCTTGGLSANLRVLLPEAALQAATAGPYSTALTITIGAG